MYVLQNSYRRECCTNIGEAVKLRNEYGGVILDMGSDFGPSEETVRKIPIIGEGKNYLYFVWRDGTTVLMERTIGGKNTLHYGRGAWVIINQRNPLLAKNAAMAMFKRC